MRSPLQPDAFWRWHSQRYRLADLKVVAADAGAQLAVAEIDNVIDYLAEEHAVDDLAPERIGPSWRCAAGIIKDNVFRPRRNEGPCAGAYRLGEHAAHHAMRGVDRGEA